VPTHTVEGLGVGKALHPSKRRLGPYCRLSVRSRLSIHLQGGACLPIVKAPDAGRSDPAISD